MRLKIDRSAAVLNRPACPATPIMRRAVGSWTTPRRIFRSGTFARPSVGRAVLGRRDARVQCGRRIEAGVFHAERRENAVARELVERLAAHSPHDVPEQEEVDVAIDEPLAGRRGRRLLDRQLDRLVVSGPQVAEVHVRAQARDMRQQMTDGDVSLAVALETRNERRDTVREPHLAVFHQHHHARRGRDHLGERREIEDRVGGHRLRCRHESAIAERLLEDHAIAASHEDHGSRQLLVLDVLRDERLNCF